MTTRAIAIALLAAVSLTACSNEADRTYQGYVEGEFVLVGTSDGGWLESVAVQRGAQVKKGDVLFTLDSTRELAQRDAAAARLNEAQSRLDNLLKGKRVEEMAVIDEQIKEANANLNFATAELERQQRLVKTNVGAMRSLEQARSSQSAATARVRELQNQRNVANLPARPDEIDAARAMVKAAQASLAEAEWSLAQRQISARVDGTIEDTVRRAGEFVPPSAAVISMLPPENIIVRFFVPETLVSRMRLGQGVTIGCDGCPENVAAQVSFIAKESEFTPPVIYSVDNREKLLFLVEARPATPIAALRPGLPVDVSLVQ